MKKKKDYTIELLLLIFAIACLVSCTGIPNGHEVPILESNQPSHDYRIVKIDGCEYIEVGGTTDGMDRPYSLTHKGNCPNLHNQTDKQ